MSTTAAERRVLHESMGWISSCEPIEVGPEIICPRLEILEKVVCCRSVALGELEESKGE